MVAVKSAAVILCSALLVQAAGFQPLARRDGKAYWSSSFYTRDGDQFASVPYGKTVNPYTFSESIAKAEYQASYHNGAPGDWSEGYYQLYIYPTWAYGSGSWSGAVFNQDTATKGLHTYKNQLRNITYLAPNSPTGTQHGSTGTYNLPLLSGQKIFTEKGGLQLPITMGGHVDYKAPENEGSIDYTDFNNGTVQIIPCGALSSTQLGIDAADCSPIVLDIVNGKVISGRAVVNELHLEATTFTLYRGNYSTRVRTQTIYRLEKHTRGGAIAGIVIGVVAVVAIVGGCMFCSFKRKHRYF
ncbi:hypothetical protein GQ54DRAFT_296742 [Martensiomyces pterosporus]|nr:hypothetical protein GQ54DRAFT_296742 [Martensiomyces pterosporus]